ncbi:MAG: hypothetical protein JKY04_00645 [Sneathiella sp.]|nr:hypothetical protein [Sneathiella sp.]
MTNTPAELLKKTLLVNATVSILAGIICLGANNTLTEFMGLDNTLYLYICGAGLALFGLDVGYTAVKAVENALYIKFIIAADLFWVAASIALLSFAPHWFSMEGTILIEAVAVMVTVLSVFEIIGFRKMTRANIQLA